jgi:hypothetical protein
MKKISRRQLSHEKVLKIKFKKRSQPSCLYDPFFVILLYCLLHFYFSTKKKPLRGQRLFDNQTMNTTTKRLYDDSLVCLPAL